MGQLRVDPDLGFDPDSTKARLFEWLLADGDVEPEVSTFVASWRKCRKAHPGFGECVALAVAHAHDKRHLVHRTQHLTEAFPKCEAVQCRTRAVSNALNALDRFSLDRNSPRSRVADASAAVLAGLKDVPVRRLFEATVGMHRHLAQAVETYNANPDDPSVMMCLSHTSQLLPALEHALWEAGQLDAEPPTRMTVTVGDALFPLLNFDKLLKLVEIVELAKALAVEVDADFQTTMSSGKQSKRRGRPTFVLLSQLRSLLHQGGFSISRIAWLVPDGPSDTEEQREAASQRVKHGLRVSRGEQTSRTAS